MPPRPAAPQGNVEPLIRREGDDIDGEVQEEEVGTTLLIAQHRARLGGGEVEVASGASTPSTERLTPRENVEPLELRSGDPAPLGAGEPGGFDQPLEDKRDDAELDADYAMDARGHRYPKDVDNESRNQAGHRSYNRNGGRRCLIRTA